MTHSQTRSNFEWQQYSSLYSLASKIIDVAQPVMFSTPSPTDPFEVVKLNSFYFVQLAPVQRPSYVYTNTPEEFEFEFESKFELDDGNDVGIADDITTPEEAIVTTACPVNGKPSCAFHVFCTLPPKDNSAYCFLHHLLCARAILNMPIEY